MQTRPVVFVFSAVLLVPFVYVSSSIPDACAYPNRWKTQTCEGNINTEEGQTCCWKEDSGPNKGKEVCQTCRDKTDEKGWSYTTCTPPSPKALKSTIPGLETQDRLPGGGVFEMPDTNATFSESNSSNK